MQTSWINNLTADSYVYGNHSCTWSSEITSMAKINSIFYCVSVTKYLALGLTSTFSIIFIGIYKYQISLNLLS